MKTFNQYCLLAAAMLVTGVANAQAPTNTYMGRNFTVATPVNTHAANAQVQGAPAGSYSSDYNSYSQDSYVSQTGSGNYATVDQSDSRAPRANGGSTAILQQTGDNNNASQTQSLANTTFSNSGAGTSRDFMKSVQAGSRNQTNQTQQGGGFNNLNITQGAGTTGNRAIQTQTVDANNNGDGNQATINQTRFGASGGTGNRAEQIQSGINQRALVDQESSNSYAKQTQSGGEAGGEFGNKAIIHQGSPGTMNTAMQTQNGVNNAARIQQSVGSTASNNYALQNQTMTGNQADITQQSSNNYAEQQQSGLAGGGNNYSSITQSNVASAAYTVQSGNTNTAIVTQH